MKGGIALCVLNAKYVHASPAPWCLAAGIKAYAPELYPRVRIVEATINQPPTQVLEQIVTASPAVAGFSCYIWNIGATLALCKELKQVLPHVVIVLGGPEVSYRAPEVLRKHAQIDCILAGEGEKSVPAFLKAIFSQGVSELLPERAHAEIPGLCGRRADGSVYESAPDTPGGSLPSPLAAGYAEAVQGRIAYFETSRGCPYSCAFCLSGSCGRPRYFALDAVLQDLLRLANSGTRTVKFVDRTFNANPRHANTILEFILAHYGRDIPQGVCFHFEIAGDIVTEDTFALLAAMPAGAVQLEIGMQSFSEKTLEAVYRKTNTALLQANIRRLVAMGNMHIHIDLIAGLPHENLAVFAESFNTGYGLGAQMLQLGFLKLLHGSAMRSLPDSFPCDFDENPPYEVRSTPWLSPQDFDFAHCVEEGVERVYNSGRFRLTVEYVLSAATQTPFAFYAGLGLAAREAGLHRGASLDEYTALLQDYCASLHGVDPALLRDCLVRDRLSTNATGRLPPCLHRRDPRMAEAAGRLAADPATAPQKGVRRGIGILYAAKAICWADYVPENRDPVTGRWELHEIPLE